jgi:hypothetical protein
MPVQRHRRTDPGSTRKRPAERLPTVSPQHERMLTLQRSAGNAAVTRMVERGDTALQRDGTGLAGKKASEGYAKSVQKSQGRWDRMTGDERLAAVTRPANAALAELGVPTVIPINDDGLILKGNPAAFAPSGWFVFVDTGLLDAARTDDTFGHLVNAVYHECRHAEQTFRVARKLAAEGAEPAVVAARLGIHVDTAKKAAVKPLSPKHKIEWDEAAGWQKDIERDPDQTDSLADTVNERQKAGLAAFHAAEAEWDALLGVYGNNPKADPRLRAEYSGPDGPTRLWAALDAAKKKLDLAWVRAYQSFKMYANLSIEQDAWATGALIQRYLKVKEHTPEDELARLGPDPRSTKPVRPEGGGGYRTTPVLSGKEKDLFAKLKEYLT